MTSNVHWLTRYDPDDGEPYGEPCHCEVGGDHNAAGDATELAGQDEAADTDPNPNSYPALAGDVTADRMCRYLTGQARQHAKTVEEIVGSPALTPAARALAAETAAMVATFGLIHMLREINRVDADEFARQIYDAWQDGAHVEEMLYQWAGEYGQELPT